MENNKLTIEISAATVWKIIGILVLVWFLYFIKDVLLLLLLAIVVVSAALPIVDRMESRKVPRPVTTGVLFLIFFIIMGLIFSAIIPQLVDESKQLAESLPENLKVIESFTNNLSRSAESGGAANADQIIGKISEQLGEWISGIFSNTLSSLGKLFRIIVVFSLSFYMLIKKDGTQKLVELITPTHYQSYAFDLVARIQRKMGRWLLGQFSLMFVIFWCDFLILSLLDVPFAMILALLGGLLEIIPYIGPITATIPATIIGFSVSPLTGFLTLAGYILIQQLENHLLTPLIMRRAVGLNPVIIILSLLVGSKLGGVLGMILAVPVATAVSVFVKDILDSKITSQKTVSSTD